MRGSKREKRPGVWELRVTVGRDPMTGKLRQVSRSFHGGVRDAEDALRKLVGEVDAHGSAGGSRTLGDALHAWLDHRTALGRSPTTLANYATKVRSVDATPLAAVRLSKLRAEHLNSFYRDRLARGDSAQTVCHFHRIIGGALRFAVRQGWVPRNEADRAEPPSVVRKEGFAPTNEQMLALIDLAQRSRQPEMATVFVLAALTGMRRGEICGLRWSDIDTERGVIKVTRSIYQVTGEVGVKSRKNSRALVIRLDQAGMDIIESRRARAVAEAGEAGVTLAADAYFFSDDPAGLVPWTPNRITQFVTRLRGKLGIPEFHFHAIRRWAGTEMSAGGIDVRDAAGRLGHADGGVVLLRHYAQARTERDLAAATVLSRALGFGSGEDTSTT